jgi:hypothetical protein
MNELVLTNERAKAFYSKYPHLDFNTMNGIFVDIMENLLQNMSNDIENGHNTNLIKELAGRLENMESSFNQHNKSLSSSLSHLSEHISTMITQHLESMMSNMRDTIRSNNGDTERNIMARMQESNELFLNRVSSLTKNEEITAFMRDELIKVNEKVQQESERLVNTFEKSNSPDSLGKINELIGNQYAQLDNSFKARIDSFFSSQSSTQGSMYTEIMNRLEKTTSAVDVVGDYFQKQIGSTNKGKHGEAKMEIILSQLFPSGNIQNTSGMTACGDFIVERNDKSKVLLDTKDYDTVVPIKEVNKLIRDVEKNNCHGILISQNSGIAQKNDFEINVHDHKIIVFMHNAKYDTERIMMAFNIIDHLEPYLVTVSTDDEEKEMISNELLTSINKEYQELVTQKLNLIQSIKKTQGDLILQVQKMDLPALTGYLDKKFANTGKTGLKCDLCNVYIGKNPKSLAAHRRRCKPTNKVIDTYQTESPPAVSNTNPTIENFLTNTN